MEDSYQGTPPGKIMKIVSSILQSYFTILQDGFIAGTESVTYATNNGFVTWHASSNALVKVAAFGAHWKTRQMKFSGSVTMIYPHNLIKRKEKRF